jgi:hypothetical protein
VRKPLWGSELGGTAAVATFSDGGLFSQFHSCKRQLVPTLADVSATEILSQVFQVSGNRHPLALNSVGVEFLNRPSVHAARGQRPQSKHVQKRMWTRKENYRNVFWRSTMSFRATPFENVAAFERAPGR